MALGLAVVAAQSVAHLVVTLGAHIDFGRSASVFDLERSNGVPDIVSTAVIVAAAVGATVLAVHARHARLQATFLAAALLVVATDDALHDGYGGAGSDRLVVLGALLAAVTLTTWIALRTGGVARTCLLVGLVLLVLDVKAPFAYDQLMNIVGQPWIVRGDVLYELGVVLDEGMELMGWVLVAVGLWDAALAGTHRSLGRPIGHRPRSGLGDGGGLSARTPAATGIGASRGQEYNVSVPPTRRTLGGGTTSRS